jgi:ATPase family associated with various cellular activities (AAA)
VTRVQRSTLTRRYTAIMSADAMDMERITPSAISKGKGRVDDAHADRDSLPWCVHIRSYYYSSLRVVGLKSIDQSLWTMSYLTNKLQARVGNVSLTSALSDGLAVEKFIEKNRLPHLLFYGPPGTGKTSTILAVARQIYGNEYRKQILEVYHRLSLLWQQS